MKKRFLLGLTGGIAAGKSLALREFARLGAETVSADDLARCVFGRVARRIARVFGTADRKKLGAIVFAHAGKRRALEKMTHPLIIKEVKRRMAKARGLLVADVPLLFEGGYEKLFDATMLVTAKDSLRLGRILRRDKLTRAQALRRIQAQMPQKKKALLADVVVTNDGNRAEFLRRLKPYYKGFELLRQGGD